MPGLDPVSLGAAGAQTLFGLGQAIFSGRKKAERNLDAMVNATPRYGGDKSINNYYQEALNRYNTNPYNSRFYNNAMTSVNRNLASGLNAMQDKRSILGGAGKLLAVSNDASNNAAAQAEGMRSQAFNQLGNATGMKSQDDLFKFKTNTIDPYQLRLNTSAMKAQAANDRFSAGVQGAFGGLGNASTLFSANKMNNPASVMNYKQPSYSPNFGGMPLSSILSGRF